jgi:Domain of unknown function (DUF4405)
MPPLRRNALKYLTDALLFVDLGAVAIVGLLLGFVIPRGREGNNFFLGLHRHAWGDIHLVLSLALMALLVLHLWLNWGWVVKISQRLYGERWRTVLLLLACAPFGLLLLAWCVKRCL